MKNTYTKTIFLIITAITLSLGIAYFTMRPAQQSTDTLPVGMMGGWAPFMTINAQGEFEGFDVDVAQELAKRMGKTLVIQDFGSVASCLIALERNRVNMIFSGLDITKERLKKLSMVPYAGHEIKNIALVFWKNVPANVTSIEDLRSIPNATVCTDPGSTQEKYLDQFDFITKKSMTSVADMILDVQYGKSLAAILEPFVATRIKKRTPEITILELPLPTAFQQYGFGIAIKKNNNELSATTSAIIKAMRQDGTLALLEKKWQLEN